MKVIAPSRFTPRRAAGDAQVQQFHALILPHLDGAYNLARYLTRDATLSEDAVQDAMLRAFRAFGQFRGESPRAWLLAIVRNCCRTAQAAKSGAMSLVIHESNLGEDGSAQLRDHPDPNPTPEEEVQRKDVVARVREAVEAIPEPFREAVVLRDLEELSYSEVAHVTGVPIGTVMSRLARGRAMLARQLLPQAKATDEQSRSMK